MKYLTKLQQIDKQIVMIDHSLFVMNRLDRKLCDKINSVWASENRKARLKVERHDIQATIMLLNEYRDSLIDVRNTVVTDDISDIG